MRGNRYLTKKEQFQSVYRSGGNWSDNNLVIRALPNGLEISRFGITVSRRVGKAVIRNKFKRLVREIIRETSIKPGFDIVFIARVVVAGAGYTAVKRSLEELLARAGLIMGEYEETSS